MRPRRGFREGELFSESQPKALEVTIGEATVVGPGAPPMTSPNHQLVIRLYRDERLSAAKVAERVGCSPDTVYSILKGYGVGRDNPGGCPPTPVEKAAEVIRRYRDDKEGATSIARDLGMNKKTVYNILGRAGVGTRPRSDRKGDTYAVAPSIVNEITPTGFRRGGSKESSLSYESTAFIELTNDAAYWIGYLICDGHIAEDTNKCSSRLFLRQSLKHIEHLKKLRSFIGTDNVISEGKHLDPAGIEQEHCVLIVTNTKLCERLKAFGMDGLKPERRVADERLLKHPHFWRGCVDADGCLYEKKCEVYLSGHVPLLDQWRDLCLCLLGDPAPTRYELPGCFKDDLSGWRARKMCSWMYLDNPGVCLPEKVTKAAKMQRPGG